MAHIADNVAELIGGTPLVRIHRVAGEGADVVAKLEAFNPASSVKDRIARSIIDAAESSGALEPGGTIIEATSGNTGIALSMVGAARGYKVVIVMPSSMSVERRAIVRAFGAELVLTDPKGGVSAAVAEAERIRDERPGSIIASQFTNPANPAVHEATTGPEIWEATGGQVDVFVAGVGTGGTISGVAKYLKGKNPGVRVIAVQPAESPLLTGGAPAPHGIQGLMPNFVPGTYDAGAVDEVVSVESAMVLVRERGRGMAGASAVTPTSMTAVIGGDREEVLAAIEAAGLTPANNNGSGQIVAAGTKEQLAALADNAPRRARLIPLSVAGAFHTHHMAPAVARLEALTAAVPTEDPRTGLLSNADGAVVTSGREYLERLVRQVANPVRWDLCMETMSGLGVTGILELAPAGTLTGIAKRNLKGVELFNLNTPDQLDEARSFCETHSTRA